MTSFLLQISITPALFLHRMDHQTFYRKSKPCIPSQQNLYLSVPNQSMAYLNSLVRQFKTTHSPKVTINVKKNQAWLSRRLWEAPKINIHRSPRPSVRHPVLCRYRRRHPVPQHYIADRIPKMSLPQNTSTFYLHLGSTAPQISSSAHSDFRGKAPQVNRPDPSIQ